MLCALFCMHFLTPRNMRAYKNMHMSVDHCLQRTTAWILLYSKCMECAVCAIDLNAMLFSACNEILLYRHHVPLSDIYNQSLKSYFLLIQHLSKWSPFFSLSSPSWSTQSPSMDYLATALKKQHVEDGRLVCGKNVCIAEPMNEWWWCCVLTSAITVPLDFDGTEGCDFHETED